MKLHLHCPRKLLFVWQPFVKSSFVDRRQSVTGVVRWRMRGRQTRGYGRQVQPVHVGNRYPGYLSNQLFALPAGS